MPTIHFEAVSKSFESGIRSNSGPALLPTTLTIESGHFVTILGGSGSGKTTLLKLINRLHKPDSGTISIDGKDIASQPETQLRLGMGYVIQQTGLFSHMTVAENVGLVPKMLGWPKAKIKERVKELLHLVGLEAADYGDRHPRQLSGGQQQRVGLARALAGDPPILLMDEPFGAVDPIVRQHLQEELLALQSHLKKTIVFVTHDVQEAFKLGDRVIVMQEGRVCQYDTPANILHHPADNFVESLVSSGTPMGAWQVKTEEQTLSESKATAEKAASTSATLSAQSNNLPDSTPENTRDSTKERTRRIFQSLTQKSPQAMNQSQQASKKVALQNNQSSMSLPESLEILKCDFVSRFALKRWHQPWMANKLSERHT